MNKVISKLAIFLLAMSVSVFSAALDLGQAKAQGLVGEKPNGYLAVVNNSAGASALIKDVNTKRRANYQGLAKKNGITLQQVETLAGKKAIQRTAKGHYVFVNGAWHKK